MSEAQVYGVTGIPRRKRPVSTPFPYGLVAQAEEKSFREKETAQTQEALDLRKEEIATGKEIEGIRSANELKLFDLDKALKTELAGKRNALDLRLAGEQQAFDKEQSDTAGLYSTLGLGVTGLTTAGKLGWLPKAGDWTTGKTVGTGVGAGTGYYLGGKAVPDKYKNIGRLAGGVLGAVGGYYAGGADWGDVGSGISNIIGGWFD